MLKAVQCTGCGYAMTVEKLGYEQQVACPSCKTLITVQSAGIEKNTIVGERYQIKQVVSENGISVVYLATDLEIADFVLIRVYSWNFSDAVSYSDDFLQMISSVSHLAEPAHVRIIDYGADDSLIYTVWSYEDMEPIEAIVKRNGPLSSAMALSICKDLALSLDKAYYSSGVGHFNLTPECIYLNSQGVVKYSDFGISAQLSNDSRFMQAGVTYWNMSFMSPEMALGWNYPDIKSDMYSLATVFYYLITGLEPHGGVKNSHEINYDGLAFPPQLEATLDRKLLDMFYSMTARNPAQRYVSWSEVVSKMDQLLYEEKMKKSSYSQRHRATLTRSFSKDMFEGLDNAPKLPNKKRPKKRGNVSQKRMSAEDVRKRLSHKEEDQPVTFAKGGGAPPSASGSRPSVKRRGTSSGRKQLSKTTTNASIPRRSSESTPSRRQKFEAEPEKSKLSIVMVLFGILFGVAIIFFIMKAALGSDKKVRLANEIKSEEKEISKQEWKDKLPPLPEPVKEPVEAEKVASTEEKPVEPEKPEMTEKEKSSRLRDLIKKLFKSVPDRESEIAEVVKDLSEAEHLAQGNETILGTIAKLREEFAPRKQLAVRMVLTDLTQDVKNYQLRGDHESALKSIESFNGPYAKELEAEIKKLKDSVLKNKKKSADIPKDDQPEVVKPGANMKQQPAEGVAVEGNATKAEVAKKISMGMTEAASLMISQLPEVEKEGVNFEALKTFLEKASPQGIIVELTKGYQKEQQSQITIRNKGQTLTGNLVYVDDEVGALRMAVVINEREIFRIADIKDIFPDDNLPRLKGVDSSQTAFLQMVYLRRLGRVSDAIKAFNTYSGPLKDEIIQSLKAEVDRTAALAVKEITSLLNLPDFTSEVFVNTLGQIKSNPEDAWLAAFKLKEFTQKYGTTNFYQSNQRKALTLSKALSQIINRVPKASVIVSEDGRTGTKTLEAAIREAKSGEVIQILPGNYDGTFDVRQKSVRLLGGSGTVIDAALRISGKGTIVKGIVQSVGNLTIASEVDNVQIINSIFLKGGIVMAGDNSSIIINNTLMHGLTIGTNKRLSIQNSTIIDNKVDKNKDRHFCVKGFITGEVNNSVIFSEANYAISFKKNEKSSTSFKNSIIFGSNSVVYTTDSKEVFNSEKDFKKNVGRVSNVLFERPSLENPAKGDFRIKEFTPGHFQGENKKSMGIQMDANLKLMNVE